MYSKKVVYLHLDYGEMWRHLEKGIRWKTGTVPAAVNSAIVPNSDAIVRKDEKARDWNKSEDLP